MKNVPSVGPHGLLDGGGRLSVGHGQVDDKLLGQILHFTGTEADVLSCQFIADFLTATVTQKECSPDMDKDVIAEVAARRHQVGKLLGTISTPTAVTDADCFCSLESSDVQRGHVALLGFEHFDRSPTMRTVRFFRPEVDRRRLSKQRHRRQFADEAAQLIG